MADGISVKANIKPFKKRLSRVKRRQLPFATSRAINDTIFDTRKHIVGPVWSSSFTVRNKRFASATFRVEKSTKGRLRALLYDALDHANLELHERGGVKRPKQGAHLAVPVALKRTATGKIPRAMQPQNTRGRSNVYKAPIRTGNQGLIERRGKKGARRVLYTLVQSVRIRPTFPFGREAGRFANRRFPRRFAVSLERALRTARP